MSKLAPDPRAVREATLDELHRLRLPLPPPSFPLVWEPGDTVELRPTRELEARAVVLHVVVARCFGMPAEAAMSWLLAAHLVDRVTPPEWQFVLGAKGDRRSFVLHHDAVFALCWVLGLSNHLDPTVPPGARLMQQMPNLPAGETFDQWRSRTLAAPRDAVETATLLDLYYCLDWSFQQVQRQGQAPPGELDGNAIGQRRWALEWAVVLRGPYHDPPGGWEEVDLSV
ncbi:MAG TPA: DUF4272 domain-containing protein [Actinoplanes sp.]|nr:DUF4272 domain-containing protein [Actinoplanes sp.]